MSNDMITKDEALNTIAVKHGHKDWELARYRLGERHLHVLILEAMDLYASQSNSHKHGVVQAEGSDSAVGATVGQRSVGTNAEARVNCAEGKHFWSMNKGIQECLFCPARREAPSGGHL